jgi:hypothetical protein
VNVHQVKGFQVEVGWEGKKGKYISDFSETGWEHVLKKILQFLSFEPSQKPWNIGVQTSKEA